MGLVCGKLWVGGGSMTMPCGRDGDGGGGTNLQLFPLGIGDSRLRSSGPVRVWQYGAPPLLWWKLG